MTRYKLPDTNSIIDALNCIEEIKKYYEGRLDLLSTLITWGMVAPLSFALKQLNSAFLNWLLLWGFTNATKSSSGKVVLALDGHHNDPDFVLGVSSIDTIPRLGDTVGKTTFPKLVDEVDLTSIYMKDVVNSMKTAIESKIIRTKFMSSKDRTGKRIPALSPLILTSNYPPPVHNSAFMRRIIDRNFPQSESLSKTDPKAIEFEGFLQTNLNRLKPIGDFRNAFLMNNQNGILPLSKQVSPLDLGKKILASAYEYVGIPMPEWFNLRLSEKQLEGSISDNRAHVKHAFITYINTNFQRALSLFRLNSPEDKGLGLPKETSDRLVMLIDNNLLPSFTRNNKQEIIIYSGVLDELYKFGATRDQIPNLKALADYMNADYARVHPGNKVVKCTGQKLSEYFDVVPKEVEDKGNDQKT